MLGKAIAREKSHSRGGANVSTPTFPFPVRLSEKYRPRKVADFVGMPKAKRVLAKFVANPYPCSFLFFGPPGVGKTSMALAMAEEMGAEFHHLGSQIATLEIWKRSAASAATFRSGADCILS